MDLLLIILLFTLLGSVISAGLAGVVLFVPIDRRESLSLRCLVWEVLLIAAGVGTIRLLQMTGSTLRS